MIRSEIDIEIDRPADEVFAYISNFENNPQWQSGMVDCQFTSAGEFGVGSTYKQIAKFLGRTIESNFEVIEYEPGRTVKAQTTSSTFPIQFKRSVEPIDTNRTRVTAIITGDATGIFKLAEPLLGRMVQGQIEGDYNRLKTILESSA